MRARLAVLALSALAACGGDSSGALSQATFGAGCAAGGVCVGGLDAPIAVGARLPLEVDLQIPGTATPPLSLRSVSPAVFALDGDVAVGIAEGVAALLVVGPDDLVLDFIHLWVAPPEALELDRRSPEGQVLGSLSPRLTLVPGDELVFSVEPVAGGQHLLGDFAATVTGGGAAVSVLEAGVARWFRLRAVAPGTASLVVEGLGLRAGVDVEVLP